MKKSEKRITPLVALAGLMCGCCCDKVATTEPHIVAKIADCARYEALVPDVDLSGDKSQDVIIAAGTESVYQGHPTTVWTADGRVIAVWCTPHGGHCGPAAESVDGGKTWRRIDDRFPKGYRDHGNCPSAYRLVGPSGADRPPLRVKQSVSRDGGFTWSDPVEVCLFRFAPFPRCRTGQSLEGLAKGQEGRVS